MFTALQTCPWCGGGMGGGMGGGLWGVGFLWPLLWLLVLAVLVIGGAYLLRTRRAAADSDRAMELLREQYARGEIGEEEFEARSARLSSR